MSLSGKRSMTSTTQKVIIGVLVGILVIVAGYSYRSTYYVDRFLPKTYVEDINVSELTVEEANKKLHDRYAAQEFTLKENDQEWKTINKHEFGLNTDFTSDLEKMQNDQSQWLWGTASLGSKQNLSLNEAVFDEDILASKTEELKKELDELNKDRQVTEDAKLTKGEDGFEITPEVTGTKFDVQQTIEDFKTELLTGKDELNLDTYKTTPKITSDNAELNKEADTLNKIAHVNASYTINGNTFEIPKDKIMDWLSYKDGKADINRDKVREYVASLGEKYNTSTNDSKFNSTKRGEVTVPAGTLSWTIAPDDETDALIADLSNGEDFTRTPIAQGSADAGAPLFSDTYVEVDLQNQHMWYYKEGKVVLETDIVSGKPKTPTPPGVFYIWNKERNATLRGTNDDGSKYAEPVDYWMPIDWTGVGIHDSNWQPAYGGELWKTVGSHGCVNTPPGVMAELFDMVEVGTPVIVL
jgi:lipoprotein-anchoring transpeptidase ErfK/SrfK